MAEPSKISAWAAAPEPAKWSSIGKGKPEVDQELCVGCGACKKICAHDAPVIRDRKASIDHDKCVGCGRCLAVCPKDAIDAKENDSIAMLNYKMAEYAAAVCKDRPCFHISLICDVSPNCDCHAENDIPIIPNVGMLASFDPVALDKACADLCNQMTPISESILGRRWRSRKGVTVKRTTISI